MIANSHRPYTTAFSGNCLCNNKLLVGKWIGFNQAMHLILFTLILMEKIPSEFSEGRPSARLWETGCLNLSELQSVFASV